MQKYLLNQLWIGFFANMASQTAINALGLGGKLLLWPDDDRMMIGL